MDKGLAGLIGAVTALAAATSPNPATAAPLAAAMQVASYADLLKPIPNAVLLLQASDAELARNAVETSASDADGLVQQVQYHDHHHHHRQVYRRRYYHHHHHHHHHRSNALIQIVPRY